MHTILKQKVYHDGTSMIVLKPGDEHEVPARFIQDWIDEKVIAGEEHVSDDASVDDLISQFTMKHVGFGEYLIEGPGVEPDTKIKGKNDAETFIEGVIAARLADAGTSDAPA